MKKYLPVLLFLTLCIPSVAFASWWNPLSWSWFNKLAPTTQSVSSTTQSTVEQLSKNIEVLQKQIDDKSSIQTQKVVPKVIESQPKQSVVSVPSPKTGKLTNKEIIAKVKPATVYVSTSDGSGSGMIISSDGYILTNAHVVSDQSTVTVTLSTGSTFDGVVVGRDEKVDLAILRVTGYGLPVVEFGNSDLVEQGDAVFTLGYPFGLKGDVSFKEGTISRKIFSEDGLYLETSAEIHPGNSGGPLVDTNGKVMGINTASLGQNIKGIAVGETIKFAIPINIAKNIIPELKAGRQVILPKVATPATGNPFQSEDSNMKVAKCQAEKQQAYNAGIQTFEQEIQKVLVEVKAQLAKDRDDRIAQIYAMADKDKSSCSSANMDPNTIISCIQGSSAQTLNLVNSTISAINSAWAKKQKEAETNKQVFINQMNPILDQQYISCLNK